MVKQMTGGRSKCMTLINQFLFPYYIVFVKEDLKIVSIVTDDSDKEKLKFFPVAVQYFSQKKQYWS